MIDGNILDLLEFLSRVPGAIGDLLDGKQSCVEAQRLLMEREGLKVKLVTGGGVLEYKIPPSEKERR